MALTKTKVPAAPITQPGATPLPAAQHINRPKRTKRTHSSSASPSNTAPSVFNAEQGAIIGKMIMGIPGATKAQKLERFLTGARSIASVL